MKRTRSGRAKRIFDVVVAGAGLVVLSPVFAAVSVAVRRSLGPPVLFRHIRPGLHGEPFVMYKFRTMHPPRGEGRLYEDEEERLTRLGRFLRSVSLDELPELVNVLRGDMSLVGPRPLIMEYLDRYTPEQARRHLVRPGITGWAQVNGRNALDWERRFELDVEYVDSHTLWFDLKILALTVWRVLRREGVTAEGYATSPMFLGTAAEGSQGLPSQAGLARAAARSR